jgi:endonuclease/exonuclease/phosphatase (EEP) superfamily protein YafD
MYIKLNMPTGVIMNIATYFPYPHSGTKIPSQSLINRITQWLIKANDNRSPRQYLQQTISTWITEHTLSSSANSVIVSGDFNATWTSLKTWATTNQLSNPFIEYRQQLLNTSTVNDPQQPQRVIDHTLIHST